ncbi:hypothetical protein C8J56DRAFT_928050 [Mycena floridula]|nr:hypothetical protein C8J56DRAFT_928050 [Mycena floridula]
MSAYGAIVRANVGQILPVTIWSTSDLPPSHMDRATVTVHHTDLKLAQNLPGLIKYLWAVFSKEVEDGMTYPQEGPIDQAAFEAYFFAADVFIAISSALSSTFIDGSIVALDISETRGERTWEEAVAGFYYVKPNYPGRSSHICNAGFVVPPAARGRGYGSALAKSYVFNAPQLGYEASVFNLVFVNNLASIKLWERLNFTKAGLIPRAGRLKRKDGDGEEFVDAWVFYKSF